MKGLKGDSMIQRNKVLAAVALMMGMVSANAGAEEQKIGVVDMQTAIQSVEAGKNAKAQLEKEVTAKRNQIQGEEASFKKAVEEFKKQSLVMSDEARTKKERELQERGMKLQEMQARSTMELQQKERTLLEPILTKMRATIQSVAKQKGYTLVLEKNENTVLFSQDKDDMTSEVISAFNKQKG